MGLTGIILALAIKMVRIPSRWIKQIGIKTASLLETLEACEQYSSYSYSVAWIDPHARGSAMGRGYLMCGEFAQEDELSQKITRANQARNSEASFNIPAYCPVPLMNLSIWTKIINGIYHFKSPRGISESIVTANEFFFPLQHINLKLFGGGHITYQFVLPYESSREGLSKIFKIISESGQGSFISVLKLFGKQDQWPGNLSFPMEGYNLGIDFKVSSDMFKLFRELDAVVLDYGGRHYLTKDVCLSAKDLRRGYGTAVDDFLSVKRKWDPDNLFRSVQSMRLELF
jgi:FAD/FMN-containing dehydrogenase